MKVRRFFLRLLPRLGIFVLSVLLLSVLTFYISRLAPGDPLVSYYGDRVEKMSPAEREWAEDKLGLNDPLPTQYARWFSRALHGDFGISYKYKIDVLELIGDRIGNTLLLGGLEPWPRMELELFPSCGGTLIVARPSEGLAVEVADYALPFLRGN